MKVWGTEFSPTFEKIGELHSIPSIVNVIALTATATTETFHIVVEKLSMVNPVLVAIPLNQYNIKFIVHPKTSVEDFVTCLCEK